MVTPQTLPAMNDLRQLSREVHEYPVSGLGISQHAEHLGYGDDVIDFTKLFSQRTFFSSRSDFINRCSLLERLLKEQSKASVEHLRSPQD